MVNPSTTLMNKIGKEGDWLMLAVTKGEKKPQSACKRTSDKFGYEQNRGLLIVY